MKHDLFEVFRFPLKSASDKELDAFLKRKDVTPKSLSICHIEGTNDKLVSIGYTKEKSEQEFHLFQVGVGVLGDNLFELSEKISEAAAKINGVICQDVTIIDGEVTVTFLTTK